MDKIILHLCADIGSDTLIYAKNGYRVIKVGKDIGVENFVTTEKIHGIIANPVCTEFSFAKYANNGGIGDHEKGLFLVRHCQRIIEECKPEWWAIENPATGRLKDFLGKPDFTYEPWHFGDPWTKKTALWGNFNKPKKLFEKWEDVPKIPELYIRPNRGKPSLAFLHKSAIKHIRAFDGIEVDDDMGFRSLCSQGFANEFFKVNR